MHWGSTNWHWRCLKTNYGKNMLMCVKRDFQFIGQNVQMSLWQKSGIEHANHASRRRFIDARTEGILLFESGNAFNCLNRHLALKASRKFVQQFIQETETLIGLYQTLSLKKEQSSLRIEQHKVIH